MRVAISITRNTVRSGRPLMNRIDTGRTTDYMIQMMAQLFTEDKLDIKLLPWQKIVLKCCYSAIRYESDFHGGRLH